MASFNLLSWNIQILGPTKIGKDMEPDPMSTAPYNKPSPAQKAALFQTIGETVAMLNADIVSILEVCSSTAGRFERLFLKSVEKATRADWAVETVYSNKSDVYFIAYRKNAGFEVLLDKNGDPVKGLTHKDKDGKDLNFASSTVGRGGRWPGYVAFKTTAGRIFTIICYHACMGGNNQENGVINIANVAPVRQVDVDGVNTPVPVSIVSGDFNVDYTEDQDSYANVTDEDEGWADPPAISYENGNEAKTSLKLNNPNEAAPTSLTFRNHAYDNIFAHGSDFTNSEVQDMIADFVNPEEGEPESELQACARKFNTKALNKRLKDRPNIGRIQTRPPQNVTDTWRIYRRAVSDHLPVWATFDV